MNQQYFSLSLAGRELRCKFAFSETARYFGRYCNGPFPGQADLQIPSWFWDYWTRIAGPRSAHNEYSAYSAVCSTALLPCCCVFHAAAIRWKEQAYLITGPSGVGKSTRVKSLQETYPGEFTVISGDRPILERYENGEVLVHPSPWNGKEDWCGAKTAPLKGVILLARGEEDQCILASPESAMLRLFQAFFTLADTEKQLQDVADFETAIIRMAPIWQMTCHDINRSTTLLYETVFRGGQ